MQVTYKLREEDFVEAYKTHCRSSPSSKRRRTMWFVILVIFLGGFIFHAIATGTSDLSGYLPLAILAIVFFVGIRWLQLSSIKKQFRNQPAAHGPRTLILDSNGVHWRWEGGSSDFAWKNYIRWVEDKGQILLYTSPAFFNVVPRLALRDTQLAELRELLKQNIQRAE